MSQIRKKTIDWLKVVDRIPPSLARRTPPEVLYHYTSQRGLLGIVEKKRMWATHIRYLNDSQEFEHALDLAKKLLKKERDSGQTKRSRFGAKALEQLDGSLDIHTPFTVYVTSFTEQGNQLSQWRAYCPPEGGFSLSFSVSKLRAATEKRSNEFDLAFIPCLYEESEQHALIAELISTAQTVTSPEISFVFLMLRWAPAIKDEGFHEEKEWRLIVRGTRNDSSFREGRSFLTPYVEFDLVAKNGKIDCLDGVTIGPTPHRDLSEQSVGDLLEQHCLGHAVTFRSGIPFRNW